MPDIGVRVYDYESLRRDALKPRRAAVWLLATVCAVVTFITLVGIASLTGYWVAQRTRQIGIRRALGATRGQILRYFQRSEEHTSELQSLMRISYAVFCLKKTKTNQQNPTH